MGKTTHRPVPIPGQDPAAGTAEAAKKRKGAKLPQGAHSWSTQFYIETLDRHGKTKLKLQATNGGVVPVDKGGVIAGRQYQCPLCEDAEWYPMKLVFPPACGVHRVGMFPVDGQRATGDGDRFAWMFPQVPWDEIWDWGRERFAITAGAGLVGFTGYYVDQTQMPLWGHAVQASASVLFVAGAYYATLKALEVRGYKPHGNRAPRLDRDDPEVGKGYRELIRKRARAMLYGALGLAGWVNFCDALGVSAFVLDDWRGYVLGGLLAGVTTVATRPFVRWADAERARRAYVDPDTLTTADIPAPDPTTVPDDGGRMAAQEWATYVAPKLKNTRLLPASYQTVIGGWSIDILGDVPGALSIDKLIGQDARELLNLISQTYRVKPAALNFVPDEDDVRKVRMLVQPDPPLNEGELWTPHGTIYVDRGLARTGRYADGKPLFEPFVKWGWGVPSKMVLGTTGSGKSENLRKQMLIERYMSYVDEKTGQRKGLFATFLQDFKRYESYGEFKQALPAVGCTREDAYVMLGAFLREMDRRYDMLASEQWVDEKGRPREGSVKFDPRKGHGPFLSWIIDEFHEIAKDRVFMELIALLARKMRACGIRITVGTHLGTLGDMGDRGFRDMLAGGYALLGRTTDALTGIATGGQVTGDPRTLPKVPGMCYTADGDAATLLARQSFVPNDEDARKMGVDKCLYDYLFDDDNNPIGFPAELPVETLNAFGPEWQLWAEAGRQPGMRPAFGPWSWAARALMGEKFEAIEADAERAGMADTLPSGDSYFKAAKQSAAASATARENEKADAAEAATAHDAILTILAAADHPLKLSEIDAALHPFRDQGLKCASKTMRDAIKQLCESGDVVKPTGHGSGGHALTDQGRARIGQPADTPPAAAPAQSAAATSVVDDGELMAKAVELIVAAQFGSTAMLQRKLRLGFADACSIMDELERLEVVGPAREGGAAREVRVAAGDLTIALARL